MRVVGDAWWRRMKLIKSVHSMGSRAMGALGRGILRCSAKSCDPFRMNVLIEERCTVCVILPYCWMLTPKIEKTRLSHRRAQ